MLLTGLAVIGVKALRLGIRLGHIDTILRLAIPPIRRYVNPLVNGV